MTTKRTWQRLMAAAVLLPLLLLGVALPSIAAMRCRMGEMKMTACCCPKPSALGARALKHGAEGQAHALADMAEELPRWSSGSCCELKRADQTALPSAELVRTTIDRLAEGVPHVVVWYDLPVWSPPVLTRAPIVPPRSTECGASGPLFLQRQSLLV